MSAYLYEYFPVFHEAQIKTGGKLSKEHYENWGWLNFLKEIAKTKVFDIPGSGMNSIDCAKQSKAFDVLMWASEDKLRSEAEALDAEEERRQNQH